MSTTFLSDLIGTMKSYFRLGKTGPRLKDNAGALNVRNAGDSADAALTASTGTFSGVVTTTQVDVTGETIRLNSDAAGSGADWRMQLSRPTSGMTAHLTYTLPPAYGSPGQVLGDEAGNGTLSWVSAASTTDLDHYDTTSLAFGSSATVSMFTLPANAVISYIEVIIDTAFDTAATMSVGVAANASKYVGTSDVDLTMPAGTVFVIHPGLASVGTTEALEIAYSAASATAGAARVIVHYAVPA
jgi:hypothetical protein